MNGTADYSALDKDSTIRPENTTKATVVFKPTKRMKKRRQLDALVSNGKLPRRKSSSGHELLRSNDSESSEVEEFSVLEGQKWGRRFPPSQCCTTFYMVIIIVVMTACVLASATFIWMHLELKRDFNSLRDRLELVENKNAGTPEEFQALQSRLLAVNRTVAERTKGLDILNKSITDIKNQISSLETRTTKLEQSLPSRGTSDKENKAVADAVASLGSDLQSARAGVEELKNFQKSATTQLGDLSDRIAAIEKPGGREGGSAAASVDTIADLQSHLSQMNASLIQKVDQAAADNSKLKTRMDVLEAFATELQSQLQNVTAQVFSVNQSHIALEAQVRNLTQAASIKKAETEQSTSMGPPAEVPEDIRMTNLENQLQMLKNQIDQIQADHSSLNSSQGVLGGEMPPTTSTDVASLKEDHDAFLTFKMDTLHDIQVLNGSVMTLEEAVATLNTDVGAVYARFSNYTQALSNVSAVVEGLVRTIGSQKEAGHLDGGASQGDAAGSSLSESVIPEDTVSTSTETPAGEEGATSTQSTAPGP